MNNQKELIPMRPGDLLRYEREQKGLTVEMAAGQSRIKHSVLTAIESGKTSDIPSVYLRGYIRNYARFLGVDSADIEGRLEHVKGAEPEVRTVFTVKTKRGNTEKWLKASSYLAASVLIATLAWQFTHEAVRFSQGESQLTAEPVESGEPATQSAGPDKRPANTHINASIASAETLGKPRERVSNSAAEQAWAAISGAPEAGEKDTSRPHSLSLIASADTWVEISDAIGDQLEMDLIRAGSSREYEGQAPFDVMIGRASAVVLEMDGSTIDLGPHTRGNVARMTLQQQ